MAAESRRIREARESSRRLISEMQKLEQEEKKETVKSQEELELERAYGAAALAGDFEDDLDDDIPWHLMESKSEKSYPSENPILLPPPANDPGERWRVTIMEDHKLEYPDLCLDVFVNGSVADEAMFAEMFSRACCKRARSIEESDLVVFTGGPDVDPTLYGHARYDGKRGGRETKISTQRDSADLLAYDYCRTNGVPMFGVCRGMQFIHTCMGGILMQDVDNHVGDHSIYVIKEKRWLQNTSSVHHQMCMPNIEGGMEVIATSNVARNHRFYSTQSKDFVNAVGPKADIEALYYRDIAAFGVQGHPEYRTYNEYTIWCLMMIRDLIDHCPDITRDSGFMRIKKDILQERDGKGK
jgi:gamma-glutamyl-gamma-aminobutyrate hydrolase PuuD